MFFTATAAPGLGGDGHQRKNFHPRFLEGKPDPAYKCQRAYGSRRHHQELCTQRGVCKIKCRQSGGTVVPPEVGRKEKLSEQNFGASFSMVLGKQNPTTGPVGAFRKNVGRPANSLEPGQGGLHIVPCIVQKDFDLFSAAHHPHGGHVFESREHEISPFCDKISSPPSHAGKCAQVRPSGTESGLCKPSLESDHALVGQIVPQQTSNLPSHHSLLGFRTVVAPINKNVQAQSANASGSSKGGNVSELLGHLNASSKVAPSLHHCFRFLLEQQQVEDDEIRLAIKIWVMFPGTTCLFGSCTYCCSKREWIH